MLQSIGFAMRHGPLDAQNVRHEALDNAVPPERDFRNFNAALRQANFTLSNFDQPIARHALKCLRNGRRFHAQPIG